TLTARMRAQTDAAIGAADVIFLLIDARAGLTPLDRAFAKIVRQSGRPTILIANKSEGRAGEAGALDAFALGFGASVALSAEHGEGMADLYDALVATVPQAGQPSQRGRARPRKGDL